MAQRRCAGCMGITEEFTCEHCGWPGNRNNEPHQLPVGTVLRGQYMVGRVLGQGGFGITYLGWDAYLEASVAIKEYYPSYMVSRDHTVSRNVRCYTTQIRDQYSASKARFLREARMLAKFQDEPAVVHIRSCFEENDTAYIIMEYLHGETLAQRIQRFGPMKFDALLELLKPVMEALEDVHQTHIVHRDISPDNIMILPDGRAKLLDFGAARDSSNGNTTETVVKHGFAPFEQYQNKGDLGPWTDVYALCATVYYCLTGKIPAEALTRITDPEAMDWSGLEGMTPGQQAALRKGMEVQRKDRIQSVKQLMRGLIPQEAPREDLRTVLEQELRPQIERELRPRIERELRPQIEQQLRREMAQAQGAAGWQPPPIQEKASPAAQPTKPAPKEKKAPVGNIIGGILMAMVFLTAGVFFFTAKEGWVQKGQEVYYYDWPGVKYKDTWYRENGNIYYFDEEGVMATGFRDVGGFTYYFGKSDGRMRTGWQEIDGEVYYFGESDGHMRTGRHIIYGRAYVFDDSGRLTDWLEGHYPRID